MQLPPDRAPRGPAVANTVPPDPAPADAAASRTSALATQDQEVVSATQADEVPPTPFEAILAAHEVEIYRHLRRLSPTAEDAADLHQETFLRAFRAYPRLDGGANVRAWLYRIATNTARDAHRRRRTRTRLDGPRLATAEDATPRAGGEPRPGAVEPRSGAEADPHARVEAGELRDAVRQALLTLTARQRIAVVARVFEEQDYPAVAALLDCNEVTARQHVHHGLRRLQALLSDQLEVPA